MTRGWKIVIGIVVAVVAFNLVLRALGSLTGGTPGGPRGSSYATQRGGVAAYAALLGRAQHDVEQSRALPRNASLDAGDTVFVLDPPSIAKRDVSALRAFARAGGRLVVAGNTSFARGRRAGPHVVHEQGLTLATDGLAWKDGRFVRRHGTVIALADASPLENRLLDRRDNAAFGLRLAGTGRRVVFLESYHGYGTSSGLAALPLAWKLLLPGLALAVLVYMVARGRRFGPPERPDRELPPPRLEYVDSLAAVLTRTGSAEAAFRGAAQRVGLDERETQALLGTEDPVARQRALARIGQDPR